MKRKTRFRDYFRLRVPRGFPEAIAAGATKRMTTSSEYVRRAVLKRLKADGVNVKKLEGRR